MSDNQFAFRRVYSIALLDLDNYFYEWVDEDWETNMKATPGLEEGWGAGAHYLQILRTCQANKPWR